MTIREAIQQLESLAAHDLKGADAEFKLYSRMEDHTHVVDPDTDVFDFEFTRGDGVIYVEFD